MISTTSVVASLIVLPLAGLLAWAWYAMARLDRGLRDTPAFEKAHFDIGPQGLEHPQGPPCATPG